jgi:hypothetical protein
LATAPAGDDLRGYAEHVVGPLVPIARATHRLVCCGAYREDSAGPRKGGPTLELGGLPETASGLTSRELSCTPTGWTDNGRERASFHSMALDRPRSRGWAQRYEEAPETGGLGASSVPWGNHDGGGKPHHCALGIRPNCRFNPPKKRKPDWLAELPPSFPSTRSRASIPHLNCQHGRYRARSL